MRTNKHVHLSLVLPLIFGVACSSSDAKSTLSAELSAACAAGPAGWAAGTSYTVGAVVSYKGGVYRCLQAHAALDVWPPDVVPALWEPVSCGAAGSQPPAAGGSPGGGATPGGSSPTGSPPTANPPTGGGSMPTPPAGGSGTTEVAPYFYSWGWGNPAYPFTGLADLRAKTGLPAVTVAFVL